MMVPDPPAVADVEIRVREDSPPVAESGRLGRAELLAKRGSTGKIQTPAELVPIPESSVKVPESCCIL